MPLLGGCCFCLDLKVGTKIIGVLKLISALVNSLTFAAMLVMLVIVDAGVDTASKIASSRTTPDPSTVDDDYQDITFNIDESVYELIQQHIGMVKVALYVLLAFALLLIITSSMLIHGIRRNRRGLLLPYLVQETVAIVLYIALIIAPLVVFGSMNVIVYFVLGIAFGILVHIYLLLVVVSQYQALGLIQMHEEISMK